MTPNSRCAITRCGWVRQEHGFSWDRDKEVPSSPQMPPGTKPQLSLLLEPGSLLVLSGDAFTYHRTVAFFGRLCMREVRLFPAASWALLGLIKGLNSGRKSPVHLTLSPDLHVVNCCTTGFAFHTQCQPSKLFGQAFFACSLPCLFLSTCPFLQAWNQGSGGG